MLRDLRRRFDDLPVRYKLLATHSLVCALFLAVGGLTTYSLVRRTVESHIESELRNSTASVMNLVRTALVGSTRNYLRAVADRNLELVEREFQRVLRGEATEAQAKARAAEILLHQRIGRTGYLVCLDSRGVMRVHPNPALVSQDLSQYAFVRRLRAQKRGYFEYAWQNPGDAAARPKAAYMAYFAPWDWIIMASSYRNEFADLVNVADLRQSVLDLRFGASGYCFLVDTGGNIIVHPKMEGTNVARSGGPEGAVFDAMLRQPTGKLIYSWRNPGESRPRKKLLIYDRIPEYGWIVASSMYLDELYGPLRRLRTVFAATMLATFALVLPLSLWVGSSITSPLQELRDRFARGAAGDFSCRMATERSDEVGQLAGYFDAFMEKLEAYDSSLRAEIADREQAESALRLSEELFAKAFRSSPTGIAILRVRDRRFVDANDAFLALAGFGREELLDHTAEELGELAELCRDGDARSPSAGREVAFRDRAGALRQGRVSAEAIAVWDEPCVLFTVEDVTDWRRLEREVIDAGDKERRRIGQDLHDDLAPHLIGIEVLSKVLTRKLSAGPSPEVGHAEQIRSLIGEAIQKARALARGLCPVHLEDRGLAVALRDLSAAVGAIFSVPCDFVEEGPVAVRDNAVATQLYYVASEAIHNAVKHAAASRITVELAPRGDRVRLCVRDDGRGIPAGEGSGGMGLRLMAHRAQMIGGQLSVESGTGQGTSVCVVAPAHPGGEETT